MRYGPERVGLLTGDNSINGEAPIVVMTTEVLRNMLYAGSGTLAGLQYVGHGRGALPRRPLAWRGVGGGHHPPARVGRGRLVVGDRVQRRGVRRLAQRGSRRQRHHRRGAAPGPAVPARDGRRPALRPVRGHPTSSAGADGSEARREGPAIGGLPTSGLRGPDSTRPRARQPGADAGGPRRLADGSEPAITGPGAAATGGRPVGRWCRVGSTWSTVSTPRRCCRRSCSSSAARAATPPSSSASAPTCG